MGNSVGSEITAILRAWREGNEQALEELTPEIYRELHRAAQQCMRHERDGHTLQTTALINELYLRLPALQEINWQNRGHFFATCARQMRRILIDMARARRSHKRGSGDFMVSFDDTPDVPADGRQDLVAVDGALKELAKVDPRKSQVVELRFFGGLTVEDTAKLLQVSPETVARDWRLAKAWLLREMTGKRRSERNRNG